MDFFKFTSKQRDIKIAATSLAKKFSNSSVLSQTKIPKRRLYHHSEIYKNAEKFAKDSQNFSDVLIDGDRLAELMIKYKARVQNKSNL